MESPLPANSRVTVQCTDPSGVFNAFEPLLSQRLPLRNLHWKSPTRPLRAINSLHIALEQAKHGQTEAQPSERRHQIPGLRQTPYLKIYLLRCDDKETYKSTCRKQIREWIKSDTQSPDNKHSSSQEGHDAFEYLIVHVVLPHTTAASEPRVSKNAGLESASINPTDSTDSVNSNSKSKWPGKGSSTVYDKIRADFNGSSKAALERVAQIRIVKDGSQQQAPSSSLGSTELAEQWQDLVDKLKAAILNSFDRRVRQYEADIRERDSQRNLPGWNFCTFFILKEGLARGFESVGLLEDALVGYDELAAGLDGIIREEAVQKDDVHSATFLPFSKDLKSEIRSVIEGPRSNEFASTSEEELSTTDGTLLELDESLYPLNPRKKPYRELILSNNISVFDLRTYIFTRQQELLLRRANLVSDTTSATNNGGSASNVSHPDEPSLYLAQICQRAVALINLGAQTLRHELYRAWGGHDSQDSTHMKFQKTVIDNIVSSWVYCAALQMLTQTQSPLSLSAQSNPMAKPRPSTSSSIGSPTSPVASPAEPGRDNSDHQPNGSSHEILSPTSQLNGVVSSQLQLQLPLGQPDPGNFKKIGTQDLASWRAELYLLARRTVAALGRQRNWIPDISRLGRARTEIGSLDVDKSLDGREATESSTSTDDSQSSGLGLEPPLVEHAAQSRELFSKLYESLTHQAHIHFIRAGKSKSANRSLTDLALLKYQLGDYESAVSYFEHVADGEGADSWGFLHGSILELYADCLKRLKRTSPFIRVVLKILTTYTASQQSRDESAQSSPIIQALVDDLCSFSTDLDHQVVVPMTDIVKITSSELCICHHEGQDGFYVPLSLRNNLGTTISFPNGVKMVLTARDGSQTVLELRTRDSVQVSATSTEIILESNITTVGWFEPRRLELVMGNVIFLQEYGGGQTSQPLESHSKLINMSALAKSVLVYPAVGAFLAKVTPPPQIHLPQPRSMLIEIHSGWNNVRACSVRLKAATAGLRLQVRKAVMLDTAVSKDVELHEGTDSQSVSLTSFSANSRHSISVPYTLESADTTSLVTRIEFTYTTEHGQYTYLDTMSMNTILPIKVNVEDIFQESMIISRVKIALTSRLTISPATLVPLRIESCDIAGSEIFGVASGAGDAFPMDVFPQQPASLVYSFIRRKPLVASVKAPPLAVLIDFHCLDQVVLAAVESQFLKDIAGSPCANLARPLSAHLLSSLHSQWTQGDLEVACLVQAVDIWSYGEIGWDAICAGLPRAIRSEAEQWLRDWHHGHRSIALAHTNETRRQISIPIEIPAPGILLTVDLTLTKTGDRYLPVAVGEPLAAVLSVAHTGQWEEEASETPGRTSEFYYEVVASPDTWLVGGRRRGRFTTNVAGQTRFPIVLIPQRPGHLLLPSVDVRSDMPEADGSHAVPRKSDGSFEVTYKGRAKSVLVTANLRETKTTIETESLSRASQLADSQRKEVER